jgi:hypothetical protein
MGSMATSASTSKPGRANPAIPFDGKHVLIAASLNVCGYCHSLLFASRPASARTDETFCPYSPVTLFGSSRVQAAGEKKPGARPGCFDVLEVQAKFFSANAQFTRLLRKVSTNWGAVSMITSL